MKHTANDLRQMQSLPLEAKIRMTKERIKAWYESWTRFEIYNEKTKKTRFVTMDTRNTFAEPELKGHECIMSVLPGQMYISFSGGKESTVLKHIVDSMYDDVPAVFVNTGLEYPEIQRFVRDVKVGKYGCFNSDVEILRPEMRFDEVVKIYGYPIISKGVSKCLFNVRNSLEAGNTDASCIRQIEGKYLKLNGEESIFNYGKYNYLVNAPFLVSHRCCDIMKKKPFKKYERETGRKPLIGTRAQESKQRAAVWIKDGCNAFEKKNPSSQPLAFWTEQDILHYLKEYNVPYCPVYGDIVIDNKVFDNSIENQINIIDLLECYEKEDVLKTTGCDRTGCMFCMFGCHLEKEPNRFQRMKETHQRRYEYCIGGGEYVDGKWQPSKEGLGLGKVLDYINVKYD